MTGEMVLLHRENAINLRKQKTRHRRVSLNRVPDPDKGAQHLWAALALTPQG